MSDEWVETRLTRADDDRKREQEDRLSAFVQSPTHRGLLRLLEIHPTLELVELEWVPWWVLVTLGQMGEGRTEADRPAWALHRFAIYRRTGAVHMMDGAEVLDPPLIEL